MSILEKIEDRIVLGDGRIDALLGGVRQPAEALCMEQPDLVAQWHIAFADAGSEVIRTNSFAANSVALAEFGLADHVNEINWQASQIARQAVKGRGVTVAGSVGPLPIAKHPAAEAIFREQIGALLDGGAQMIFFEGFRDLGDLLIALEVKYSLHHCPAVCAMVFDDCGLLEDGMPFGSAFAKLIRNEADVVGSCGKLPVDGGGSDGDCSRVVILPHTDEHAFSEDVRLRDGLGGCLVAGAVGVSPDHIAKARSFLAER